MAKYKRPRLPTGRFATVEQAKHFKELGTLTRREKQKQEKLKQEIEVKKTYERREDRSLGKKLSLRATDSLKQYGRRREKVIRRGRRPTPDLQENYEGGIIDTYQFVGRDAQPVIASLLIDVLEKEKPRPLTKISLGTGYGRYATWIGSKWMQPREVFRWVTSWEMRPSADVILQADDRGELLWWELEVLRRPEVKVAYVSVPSSVSRVRRKAVSRVQRRRKTGVHRKINKKKNRNSVPVRGRKLSNVRRHKKSSIPSKRKPTKRKT